MTTTQTSQQQPAVTTRREIVAGLVEAAASLTAWLAIGGLLSNKADTSIAFFGETPTVRPENVTAYHHWLTVLVLAVVVSFAAARLRDSRTGTSFAWHGFVLLAGALAAVALHVSIAAPAKAPPAQHHAVCYSGGDSDECPGG